VKSLSFRLLLFNVLLLFLPLGSLLYLDTYENQLLAAQEASLIQQGRLLGSALSAPDGSRLAEEAARILRNLAGRVDARIRVVDAEGRLVADSAAIAAPSAPAPVAKENPYAEDSGSGDSVPNTRLLYRAVVYPLNVLRRLVFPPSAYSPAEFYSGRQVLLGPEVRAALEGRYGAATRYSSGGQVSVNLYSAIPVFADGASGVIGAVLVSRSSYGILLNLYRLRLDIIKIFCLSLLVSLSLSLLLSFTITRPLKRLRAEAERVLDTSGKFSGHFRGLRRRDEIGDLSRSLAALSAKLERRTAFIDTFISDLYHELKNPLAAIRGQTELSLASPVREAELLAGIQAEERRMERLLARLRDLSRIDNGTEQGRETILLADFIPLLAGRCRQAEARGGPQILFTNEAGSAAAVWMNPDSLTQVLANPLDNAVSFSPPGGKVAILLAAGETGGRDRFWRITIDDEGPGVREETGGRYFERFYSERSAEEKPYHSGLGLAIVRAICESVGGRASLENRPGGGCRFTLYLPRHPDCG
jgi:two-component system sensor histidine kinase ChvG